MRIYISFMSVTYMPVVIETVVKGVMSPLATWRAELQETPSAATFACNVLKWFCLITNLWSELGLNWQNDIGQTSLVGWSWKKRTVQVSFCLKQNNKHVSWWIWVNLPYLTSQILPCDCLSCTHCDVDAETTYRAALISDDCVHIKRQRCFIITVNFNGAHCCWLIACWWKMWFI